MAGRPKMMAHTSYTAGSHTFQIVGPFRPCANQRLSIFDVSQMLDKLPTALVEGSKVISITLSESEDSTVNSQMAKNTNKSATTAGAYAHPVFRTITYCQNRNNDNSDNSYALYTLAHELAHLYDSDNGSCGVISGSSNWAIACNKDFDIKKNRYHITLYAQSYANAGNHALAMMEDFAETVGYFFGSQKNCLSMLQLWPNRVAFLRSLFGDSVIDATIARAQVTA